MLVYACVYACACVYLLITYLLVNILYIKTKELFTTSRDVTARDSYIHICIHTYTYTHANTHAYIYVAYVPIHAYICSLNPFHARSNISNLKRRYLE